MYGTHAGPRAVRAERLREAAIAAAEPAERLVLAYQAARAKATLLLGPRPRRGNASVWARLAVERPAMEEWARALAGYSGIVGALEAGMPREVSARMAADVLWAVGEFFNRVESELEGTPRAA